MTITDRHPDKGQDLVDVRSLKKTFRVSRNRVVNAISDVSFTIKPGETLALVGESGSGKTTVGRCLLRILDSDSGEIRFSGTDIARLERKSLHRVRRSMQIVFQDPSDSLNPRRTVEQSIYEPLTQFPDADPRPKDAVIDELLLTVGLDPKLRTRYPIQLTSGEQQRVAVARPLATGPELIVLDEPTSSLDPVAREQLIDLLKALQRDRGMALLFISHDLVTVRHIAHRVAVMYLGEIVESGPVGDIFARPIHPYTQALIAAVPSVDRSSSAFGWARLDGEIPSPINLPTGCYLASRCAFALPECTAEHPELLPVFDHHQSRCARTTGVLPSITSREIFEPDSPSLRGEAVSHQTHET